MGVKRVSDNDSMPIEDIVRGWVSVVFPTTIHPLQVNKLVEK